VGLVPSWYGILTSIGIEHYFIIIYVYNGNTFAESELKK
jgi:hypothetical protein